jgi:pimeloyl-ACP methyl ester carboxylesterase
MINQLLGSLQSDGYDIQQQVFLEGHSVGGVFAQRYALLHPQRVRAIAAQIGGSFTLPESTYKGTEIVWPIGIADYASLAGYEFARDAYKRIPQYIYTGDQDLGAANPLEITPGGPNSILWDMGFDHDTASFWIQFLEDAFGQTDPVKTRNQVGYLNSLGYNKIAFHLYPGIGHQQTSEMLDDAMKFFDTQR